MEMKTDTPDRFIGLAEVMTMTGQVSRATIFQMKKERRFPQSVRIGRRALWVEREVRDWMAQQVAKRDADKPDDVTARCNEQLGEARAKRRIERKRGLRST